MAITYTWNINQLSTLPSHEGQKDVVVKVQWSIRGVDENGVGSSRGAITELTYAGGAFTPYNELTKDVVVDWVKATLNKGDIKQMESEIAGDITWQNEQSNSNEPVSQPVPWKDGPEV